jgi:hypothetical protein
MKLLTRLALMLAFAVPLYAQTHTLPAPDTNNPRTDNQNFTGRVSFGGPWPYYDATSYGASGSGQTTTGSCNGTTTVRLEKALDFQNGQGIALYGCGTKPSVSAPSITSVVQSSNIPPINFVAGKDPIAGATCSGTTATITTRGYHGLLSGESITVVGVGLSVYNGIFTITAVPANPFPPYPSNQIRYTITSCPASSSGGTITLNVGSHTYAYEVASIDANNAVTAVSSAVSVSSANTLSNTVFNTVTLSHVINATMYALYRKIDAGSYSCVGTIEQPKLTTVSPTYVDYGATNSCAPNAPSAPPSSPVNGILVTTISSGAGTTALTLAASASATVPRTIVQHDDTAAINAAWVAASTNGLTYSPWGGGGAQVVLPLGTYYVQNLLFPVPNPGIGASMQVVTYGQILNRQPITLTNYEGGYTLTGVVGAAQESGSLKGKVSMGLPGVAPEFDIAGASATTLENLSWNYCSNDCIKLEVTNVVNTTFLTLSNDYGLVQSSVGPGAALHCTSYVTGDAYGVYVVGGTYAINNGVGPPAILSEGCDILRGTNVTVDGGAIEISATISSLNGFVYWDGGITEAVPTAQFIFNNKGSNRITDVHIKAMQLADNPYGGDNTFVKQIGVPGLTQAVTIEDPTIGGNATSAALFWEGGIQGLNIPDCYYPGGVCQGTAGFPPNYATTSSGRFTDYSGAQWYFGNPYGASPVLHLVAAGANAANLLQCENPLVKVVCSLDQDGNFAGATSSVAKYSTATNCTSSASPAVCGSAAAGAVTIPAGSSSVVVHTTAVTANSDISLTFNSAIGARLSVTCNTTAQQPTVSAMNSGTGFTISVPSNFITNPGCISYSVIN